MSPGENDDEVFSVLQYYYLATFVFPQLLLSIDEQLGNKKDHMLSVENNDAVLKVNFKQFLTEVFYSLVMVPFTKSL
ncbi:MAG: hypothetical protein HWD59_01090 [Coxiellaceae bacterium]|nr:MAG: hypothetical protein HWD59_01090 [Coxiellaceae bacterium]